MRIAIDARPLTAQKAGIGYYTENLLLAMAQAAPNDEFFLFSNKEVHFSCPDNCRAIVKGRIMGNIWLQSVLPILLHQYQIDLLHSPMFLKPLATNVPTIITVHDMVYRLFPETTNWKNWIMLQALLPSSMRTAIKIIAVSQNTKRDILRFHQIQEDKIQVIHLGSSKRFQIGCAEGAEAIEKGRNGGHQSADNRPLELSAWLSQRGVRGPYILTVGTLEPRKNLVRLFKAFARLLEQHPQLDYQLLVVGSKGWRYDDIFSAKEQLKMNEKIIFLDYLAEEFLPAVYQAAELFVFPSLYEGFGLPPLEAMASGVPVVSSSAGSLTEVLGQAAVLVDPTQVDDISNAMADVLLNPQKMAAMRREGLRHAAGFTWEKAAAQTLKLYWDVLK